MLASRPGAFAYTGGPQDFTVPPGVTECDVELWGGGGGGAEEATGGGGGYTRGTLQVAESARA